MTLLPITQCPGCRKEVRDLFPTPDGDRCVRCRDAMATVPSRKFAYDGGSRREDLEGYVDRRQQEGD